MKLVTYTENCETKLGVIVKDMIYDLRKTYYFVLKQKGFKLAKKLAEVRIPNCMVKFIEGGEKAYQAAQESYNYLSEGRVGLKGSSLKEIQLEAPIVPKTIICGGANFYDHLDETKRSKPDEVEFFLKSPHCVVGPKQTVEYETKVTRKYDYEVELGIIIKKPGRFIPVEKAFDYIFGYTIINDISARDRQVIPWGKNNFQLRFGEGKNYDTGCPIGPWIITSDELRDVSSLELKTWVNSELRQNNNTKNLIWDVPNLVSYYSRFMTLKPGFLIASGTPGGPALGSDVELGADPYEREDGVKRGGYMQPGDLMKLKIEKIGILQNKIDFKGD